MDIASGLEYLHCGCESTIIHGDLKPSNVLLDDEMTAHIGDFGLVKIISTVSSDVAQGQSNSVAIWGITGYVAPDSMPFMNAPNVCFHLLSISKPSTKFTLFNVVVLNLSINITIEVYIIWYGMEDMASTLGDAYNFGILLLEMFIGKKPADNMFKDHLNLHNFVKNALPDRVMEIVDPCILLEHNTRRWIKDCMVSILQIRVACSMESPRDRMEIGSVISELLVTSKVLHKWLPQQHATSTGSIKHKWQLYVIVASSILIYCLISNCRFPPS
ncbi:unnamed protein product [Camellia sinensis]